MSHGADHLADNESVIAACGHEIAHYRRAQGTKQRRGQLVNLATIRLIFMGVGRLWIRQRRGRHPAGFLKFSRGFEEEADLLGSILFTRRI